MTHLSKIIRRSPAPGLYRGWGWAALAMLAAFAILLTLPDRTIAQVEQSIVVLVNDDPISAYDIEQRERFLAVTAHEQPGPALKKKATDMLIDERLQLQQGKKLGITSDDADVNKILGDMAQKNNLTTEGLGSALGQMGVNMRTLKDRVRAQLVWQDVVRRKFRHEVNVGDIDVDRAIASGGGAEASATPTEATALQLRQIKFELSGNADQRTLASRLAEAEALRARFESLLECRRAGQGHQRRKREGACRSAARRARPTGAASGDERESRADDPAYHLGIFHRALRGLRQALDQGRSATTRADRAQTDAARNGDSRGAPVARSAPRRLH